jgi:hypothetical protein
MPFDIRQLYISFRSKISDTRLKENTLKLLELFRNRVESTSEEIMLKRLPSEKWNGMEVAFHAVNSAKGILRVCEGLRANQSVPDSDRSAAGRTREVSRADLLALIKRVTDMTSNFEFKSVKTASCAHPFLGQCDFHKWLVINMVHLERHYRQLNRVLAN